ncbi:MAG: hypothetical protein KKD73_04025 [Proteobacteria bacterium]|nr:hypothetical protein [Pseudomonadota bacterium]MBU1639711.1 hypothetical protein [Pseudomonadota bacterium]
MEELADIEINKFNNIWKVITEIGLQERHFNDLQSRYRTLASTWILAAFSAIGFLIAQEKTVFLASPTLFIVSGIGVALSIGIILLWNLDIMVYHQLLAACFREGLLLEEKHPWLPRIRIRMMARTSGQGVIPRVVWFYIVASSLGLLISCGAVTSLAYNNNDLQLLSLAGHLTLISLLSFSILKQSGSEKVPVLTEDGSGPSGRR